MDVKKHSDITTGVLFWSPAGRWIVHHLTCPQSDLQSPKVSQPIRISHFFPNSQKHLTSKLKRKEPNWSLPAAAPLPIYHAPLHRLLHPTSFPQIALRGLSSVLELSRQPVRISEEGSSCSRRGRPAAHFDYLVSHSHRTGLMPCNFMRGHKNRAL